MTDSFAGKLDLTGPIDQARRCLALWLEEEGLRLSGPHRDRTAALLARYFLYEDETTDALMLSFLRHYSGRKDMDMEDPVTVRMEIKTLLDRAVPSAAAPTPSRRWPAFAAGIVIAALALGGWRLQRQTITPVQQAELKALVHAIAAHDAGATPAAVWARMKQPLGVRSYRDIRWIDYPESRALLEARLAELRDVQAAKP